jgi:hypothetical protein
MHIRPTELIPGQFEKILGLSLPERTDRRDMLSLVGTFFDIKIDWMDAVKGEDINKKAWPAVCMTFSVAK